jgi:predicted Fe-Mo cluster-binding NifX family protein
MKVAVTVWEGSISTVCDFCRQLWLFDIREGEAGNRTAVSFESPLWPARVWQLKGLAVRVLLCGALSRPLERMLDAAGIEVIPWLRGPVDEILRAYLQGKLPSARFVLPGCGRPGEGPRGGATGRCGRPRRSASPERPASGGEGMGRGALNDRGRR